MNFTLCVELENAPPGVDYSSLSHVLRGYANIPRVDKIDPSAWSLFIVPRYKAFIYFQHKKDGEWLLGNKPIMRIGDANLELKIWNQPERPPLSQDGDEIEFTPQTLRCGYYDYDGSELFFRPEFEYNILGSNRYKPRGYVAFDNNALIIHWYTDSHESWRIEMPYSAIESWTLSTNPALIMVFLHQAPKIYEDVTYKGAPSYSPLLMSSNTSRRDINTFGVFGLTPVCQISVFDDRFTEKRRILQDRGILRIHVRTLMKAPPSKPSLLNAMKLFDFQLVEFTTLPIGVVYQVDALVKSRFLLPWDGLALLAKLAASPPVSTLALKKLFAQLPFPGPRVPASSFDVSEIWALILHNNNPANYKELKIVSSLYLWSTSAHITK